MRRKEEALAGRVRDELALARGTAHARQQAARAEAGRAARDLDELAVAEPERSRLAAELIAVAERAAPASQSAPWQSWTADPAPPFSVGPHGLFRIGAVDVGAATVPVLVPLLDAAHLAVWHTAERTADAVGLIGGLLLRVLGCAPAESVRLSVYDPERLGRTLPGFTPLAAAGVLSSVGPRGLNTLLGDLVEDIRRINETVLTGQFATLRELAEATGQRTEPWRIAVLFTAPRDLTPEQRANVERVLRAGAACGVHLVLCANAGPATLVDDAPVEHVTLTAGATHCGLTSRPVRLDPPPPPDIVAVTCRAVADRAALGPEPARFEDLLPARFWTESSATGVSVPIGDRNGEPVLVTLGDNPPHALVGGPSGSGKTNFLYAFLSAVTARYAPGEVELYLLDFKEGVSFSRFARGRKDTSWLPHARLIGININEDREFGLALLRYLSEQMRVRAEAAKQHDATKLEELRAEDPTGHWPRIIAVIDEFQYLLHRRDQVSKEAVALLEDLARRGRSQGIHLILASQDVTGIDGLWGRSSIIAQFTLRVALPKARRILAEDNLLAGSIPRWHAVVNPESGAKAGNQIARIPDACQRGTLDRLQVALWEMRPAGLPEPRLFDGSAVPRLGDSAQYRALSPAARRSPVGYVGQFVDVAGSAAEVRLRRAPGRNFAVIGTRVNETCDVLGSMTLALARQHEPGEAQFAIACLDEDAAEPADRLYKRLRTDGHDTQWFDLDGIRALLADTAKHVESAIADETGRPSGARYLVLYAVDVAGALLSAKGSQSGVAGLDSLRRVIRSGPEVRVHVLGWWRSVSRLKEDLGGLGARLEDIGAWLALDVQGGELTPLPGGLSVTWYPRQRRGLFFDRSVHAKPHLVIPYDIRSCL